MLDAEDAFPDDSNESDTDGDGVGDNADAFPEDPESIDTDGDGVGDNADFLPLKLLIAMEMGLGTTRMLFQMIQMKWMIRMEMDLELNAEMGLGTDPLNADSDGDFK